MDRFYLYHLWITNTTGDKSVCDQIINSACSVCVTPELEEAIQSVCYLANHPPQDEEEVEEYVPDEDDDLWDYG